MFEQIKDLLSKKWGPVPIWAIAIVAVGGMVLYLNYTYDDSETAPDTDVEDVEASDGDAEAVDVPIFVADSTATSTTEDAVADSDTIDTNDAWFDQAYAYLTQVKSYSALETEAALRAYLAGDALTVSQSTMVEASIAYLGRPPGTLGGISTVQPATTVATRQGTPPTHHTVKSTKDDSLGELSRLYWGQNTAATVNQLRAANPTLSSANGIAVGTKIYIPKRANPKFFTTTAKYRKLSTIAKKYGITQAKIQNLNPTLSKTGTLAIGKRVQIG